MEFIHNIYNLLSNIDWWRTLELITTIATVVIACYAFIISKKTAESQLEHNKLTVRPLLVPFCVMEENDKQKTSIRLRMGFINKGIGPAIISDFNNYDGQKDQFFSNIRDYLERKVELCDSFEIVGVPGFDRPGQDHGIAVGEGVNLLQLVVRPNKYNQERINTDAYKELSNRIEYFRHTINFDVIYKSMYNEIFTLPF